VGWQGPPLLDRPAWEPQVAWGGPGEPDMPPREAPLAAIALARAMPDGTLHAQLRELLLPVGLALLATFAVTAAWALGIRGRQTLAALDVERARRAHLEELGLAAAGLAHEAKNPLGIILGLAQRIAKSPSDARRTAEAAEQIVDAADRASARLGEFIHYARIRDPALEALRGPAVVGRVASVLRGDFEAAGVELHAHADELTIRADEDLLVQALVNLLLNALHATSEGGRVSVTLEARGRRARLVVEDTGRGIPEALLADVLKPYVTGREGGHGLGLAVVKRVADQHGWTVSVWSREGEGARFELDGIRTVEEQA
jgi:signal transduction histidine kinase